MQASSLIYFSIQFSTYLILFAVCSDKIVYLAGFIYPVIIILFTNN